MIVKFTAEGIRDLGYWEATNRRLVSKINALISSIEATPIKSLGSPNRSRVIGVDGGAGVLRKSTV